jgi:dihydroorotase
MPRCCIQNIMIINEGTRFHGSLLINNGRIEKIFRVNEPAPVSADIAFLDAAGKILIPGVIDDQVHFREPGLTHKGDIYSESRAAIAGGVTSFMDMPNTQPQTITQTLLEEKYSRAEKVSPANYSFYMGATNDNLNELLKTNPKNVCGIKIFMGASTGNMLVDNLHTLEGIFSRSPVLLAVHCEDETTIRKNFAFFTEKYGEAVPVECHPFIRSAEACLKSSSLAVELAGKHNSRLHILHVSTRQELALLENLTPRYNKRITAEVCIHHLLFNAGDYKRLGNFIKWNPSVKEEEDRIALMEALKDGRIDIVATDHSPHTLEEKKKPYLKAPSGGPLVQHSLVTMLEFSLQGIISPEQVVDRMCHAPADIFGIERRGYIREGYYADLVLVDMNNNWTICHDNILYKCKWSPLEGKTFHSKVTHTFVNGNLVYENGLFHDTPSGMRLRFNR